MRGVIPELLAIVAPVYLCAALGFGWVRARRPYDTALITELVTTIGAPCLVFSRLIRLEVSEAAMIEMAMVTSVAASHAKGPMAHPQDSKNSWENARPVAAPSTATTTACDSAARQVIPQSMRARVAHRGCR